MTKIMTARDALRIVSIDAARLLGMLGLREGAGAADMDDALAARGYAMVPFLRDGETVAATGSIRLLAITDDESPIGRPTAARSLVALLENAIEIATAIGPLDDKVRGRILRMVDAVGIEDAATRSILGAHFLHYTEYGHPEEGRPLELAEEDAAERSRVVTALFSIANADGVLYDVSLERLETVLNRSGIPPLVLQGWLIGPRDIITTFMRPEIPHDAWDGLENGQARLLSWIAARPRASMREVEIKARSLGLDPQDAMQSIDRWAQERMGGSMLTHSRMPSLEDRSRASGRG